MERKTKDREHLCVKQSCVENSDLGIAFDGDPCAALSCCDDSAKRRIILKISGFIVHFVDQTMLKEIDHSNRGNSKSDLPPGSDSKKKNVNSAVISY